MEQYIYFPWCLLPTVVAIWRMFFFHLEQQEFVAGAHNRPTRKAEEIFGKVALGGYIEGQVGRAEYEFPTFTVCWKNI